MSNFSSFSPYRVGLTNIRGCPQQCLMLRMDRKAALHIVEMILLVGNKQFLLDVHKKVPGLFCVFLLKSDKTERHLWFEEIMVENRHCTLSLQVPETSHLQTFFLLIVMDLHHIYSTEKFFSMMVMVEKDCF